MGNHSSTNVSTITEVDTDAAQKKTMLTNELHAHGFTDDKIDLMLKQVNDIVGCGPVCQREKRIKKLKEDVVKAKQDIVEGPQRLRDAQRELMVYKEGPNAYSQQMRKQYEEESENIRENKSAEHEKITQIALTSASEYATSEVYLKNLDEVLLVKENENKHLLNEIDKNTGIVRTNNRRGEYQSEVTGSLRTAVKYATWTYYISVLFFFLIVVLYRGKYKNYWILVVFTLYLLFPRFILPTFFDIITWILHKIGTLLSMHGPKDAYYNL
jgi:hypothetical protein